MLSHVSPINKSFCLQVLCEENYKKLSKLIPNFTQNNGGEVKAKILNSGPYTHTIQLQHCAFEPVVTNPSFTCRVYLDVQSIEVIRVEGATPIHQQALSPKALLNNKWKMNYFFEKWLVFQLQLTNTHQTAARTANA